MKSLSSPLAQMGGLEHQLPEAVLGGLSNWYEY
jgi:hypothetical protein